MAYRFSNTDKWKDPWFRGLPPNEKLLFNYLCDNCDLAGFYEVDYPMISFQTGLTEDQIKRSFKGLLRGYLGANGWIWIINFLKHQKNLPLNPENNAHRSIINLIKAQLFRFPDIPSKLGGSEGLLSPPGKGKVEVKVKNIKGVEKEIEENPTIEDFWNLYQKKVDRKKCEPKWKALSRKDKEDIMAYLPAYIKSTPDKKFRKDPETFLNNRSWENEIIDSYGVQKNGTVVLKGDLIGNYKNKQEVY